MPNPPVTLEEIYAYIISEIGGPSATDNTLGRLLLALGAAIKANQGGSSVHTQQSIGGFIAAVATGTQINWNGLITQGDTLLDLTTDPGHRPLILVEGVYAVTFQAGPDTGPQAGKSQQLQLALDSSGPASTASTYDTLALTLDGGAGSAGAIGWATSTWYMEAGDPITTVLVHDIGAPTDYDFNLFVQRLS